MASHYAEPLTRRIAVATPLLPRPDGTSAPIAVLEAADEVRILDSSRGWVWGYGPGGEVGYVTADALVG